MNTRPVKIDALGLELPEDECKALLHTSASEVIGQ